MSKRIGLRDVPAKWQAREPFNTHNGTLYGETAVSSYGRLPSEWRHNLFQADSHGDIAYIVYSYETPIAWVLQDGTEVRPPVKYSVTTSKHQGRLYGPAQGQRSICVDCDLEIEWHAASGAQRWGKWIDRGGNETCVKTGYSHTPND